MKFWGNLPVNHVANHITQSEFFQKSRKKHSLRRFPMTNCEKYAPWKPGKQRSFFLQIGQSPYGLGSIEKAEKIGSLRLCCDMSYVLQPLKSRIS